MAPWKDVFRLAARISPFAVATGFGFETFMYYTGFWKVATRKEAERQQAAQEEVARLRAVARARREAAGTPGFQ
jgi:hypothetical protein